MSGLSTLADMHHRNLKLYGELRYDFEGVFRIRLKPFWDHLTGFDLIKFDDEIVKPKDDQSLKDAVREKYGDEGVKLLERLIRA